MDSTEEASIARIQMDPGGTPPFAFTATLTLALAVASCTQFALGVLGPLLREDLGLSTLRLGLLSSTFFAAAAAMSPPAGRLADWVGGRRMLFILFTADAVAFAGMAVARSYALMLLFVALAGATMATANPATNRLVAARVPGARRGVVIGVKQSGVQVAAFGVGALMPVAAHLLGWQAALGGCAVVAAAGLVLAASVIPPAAGAVAATRPVEERRGERELAWLAGYGFLMGAGYAAVIAYLPLYAVEKVHFSPLWAGQLLALLGAVGVIARVLWARGVARTGGVATPLVLVAASAVVADALVLLGGVYGGWLLWVAVFGFGAGTAAWFAIAMLSLVRGEGDRGSTGRASGIVGSGYYGGLLVSPFLFSLATRGGSYVFGWALSGAMFTCALVVAVVWRWAGRRGSAGSVAG